MSFDVQKIRRDFPLLSARVNGQPLVYLDNAATTQKPRRVIDRISRFYKLTNSNVHRGSHTLSNQATTEFEAARQTVAGFIKAASEEIIWTRGATEAANLLAYSLSELLLNAGDTILVSTLEHHANLVPWQQAALRQGAHLLPIPLNDEQQIDTHAFVDLLATHQPKVVAFTHVSNALGVIQDVPTLAKHAKATGACVVVDGAQAVAHLSVDVQTLGCDFYFFSGHKCYGPTGIGVLWGRKALLEAMPPWQFGGEMIEHVAFEETRFNTLPFKFEAGTPPITEAIALAEAIDYLQSLDRHAIFEHECALRDWTLAQLKSIPGITLYASDAENVGIISFTVAGAHPQDLAQLLDQQGIAVRTGHHCAMPLMSYLGCQGTLRVSFALYNTHAEAEHFIKALLAALATLQTSAPESPTLPAALAFFEPQDTAALTDALHLSPNWQARFTQLISLGAHMPGLPEAYRQSDYQVQGCESAVWLTALQKDGCWHFAADSDARLMKGLIALLLTQLQGQSSATLQHFDLAAFLTHCGLSQALSPSRTNGLQAIFAAMQRLSQPQESVPANQ